VRGGEVGDEEGGREAGRRGRSGVGFDAGREKVRAKWEVKRGGTIW